MNVWNADLYDEKMSFVSNLGKGVVELVHPQKGDIFMKILKRWEKKHD
ncbi:hypothetical protein J6TS2_37170 [Heyndrickxia sporothermodurans]|nr:hypothetical protein J6TS2_37170 [Heyndrickxia sporothermodurans]